MIKEPAFPKVMTWASTIKFNSKLIQLKLTLVMKHLIRIPLVFWLLKIWILEKLLKMLLKAEDLDSLKKLINLFFRRDYKKKNPLLIIPAKAKSRKQKMKRKLHKPPLRKKMTWNQMMYQVFPIQPKKRFFPLMKRMIKS